ncbi:MAG: hypothetical protein KDC84_01085 [Crocinitomicaceae bacterium]|nr:hypothetical protein [Crocinitomicaceae bacterium]
MLSDFFRINLPYGITRKEDGSWMAFNREYMPLGYNNTMYKNIPNVLYTDLPIYTQYKIKKGQLDFLESDGTQYNDKGEAIKYFLYDDETNPANQTLDKKELWDLYFEKLKRLSKLKKQ